MTDLPDYACQSNQLSCKVLRDEIERLRAEVLEQCRLNGMGGSREAKLLAENAQLRARVAELEVDAMRGRFLCEHWQSTMKGRRLPQWISDNALRIGSVQKAVDSCIAYAGLADRLAAMKEGSQ